MAASTPDEIARAFSAHAPALVLYASVMADRESARDAVHDAFVALARSARPADVRAWLYAAVRNAVLMSRRSRDRRRRREATAAIGADPWLVPRTEEAMDAQAAAESLRGLPDELREVVTLRIWGDLTFAEIAATTGVPVSTVHDRYRAALAAMKSRLEADHVGRR